MKIVFNKDTEFATDGVNKKMYSAGVVYTSKWSHEGIMFRYFVDKGFAEKYDASVHDRPIEQETKVARPRGAK